MKNKSTIIYKGPSLIDGKPIIVIYQPQGKNPKIGEMAQTWILREDIDPITANRIGEDYSICGNCPHKGITDPQKQKGMAPNRSCYVNPMPVLAVYKSYKKGNYTEGHNIGNNLYSLAMLGAGQNIRLGSYGDPAAVPARIWEGLLRFSKSHTGYTHQADIKTSSYDYIKNILMTSCDTLAQAKTAWKKGLRTFRTITNLSEMTSNEKQCMATLKGSKTTCSKCNKCNGDSDFKSIAIVVHGNGAKYAGGQV